MPLFSVTEFDRHVYSTELQDFLPDQIIDIHTHLWLDEHKNHTADEFSRVVSWPFKVAKDNSIDDLQETYRLMFPGKQVTPLMFSNASQADDIDRLNKYVQESAAAAGYPALLFTPPWWSGGELESKIAGGGFLGVKVYLNLSPSYIPMPEIRIFDFLTPGHLHVLNRLGLIAMLHIPRNGRLKDPVNIEQIIEINRNFPRVKLVLAHVGRAYCPEDLGDAFERLKKCDGLLWDFCANTNGDVFTELLRSFSYEQIMFGSDLPILRMRMRRICENGSYINIVPKGLYGDVSGDPHMREVAGAEAERLTFFMYEELRAMKQACTACGIPPAGREALFYTNAKRVLGSVGYMLS